MSVIWIVVGIVAVLFGLGFAGWVFVRFVEAIAAEVVKGLWK